ncbi:regulatory protein, luxR family [Chryseobacterium carnipullorum]|uniref:helix-turn-helix transcriptional regulator n=1 Tax=Chryseobacterium carnipullorum TaxID=1124835 RepID=UPI00091DDE12|nr:LuxR C-terminal-related transcriptional regulator [Chryseobacterium carnipullorum]SHL75168.1 regulatory protein, luxR family [Chryseobacterium carnipullorum]
MGYFKYADLMNETMNFKNTLFLLCILSFSLYKAQNYTRLQIDRLQSIGYGRLRNVGNYKGIVLQEMKLVKRAKTLRYDKGEITGYLNIATALSGMNDNKNSFLFLEIAENKLKKCQDDELKSRLSYVYGINYYSLGLHRYAIQSFDESLLIANKIRDQKRKEKRIYDIYEWKRFSFGNLNMMDSVYYYERKCMRSPRPMLFITIAKRHLKRDDIDSADYYIRKADDLLLTRKVPIEGKANVLRAFGELSIAKKQYKKALIYLNESLEITQKMGFKKRNLETYKLLSVAYRNLHLTEKENEYLLKYTELNDSVTLAERNVLDIPISRFLDDQVEDERKRREELYYIIVFIGVSALFSVLYLYKKAKTIKKQTAARLFLKKKHAGDLQKKINESFSEVLKMAKEGSPHFWTRFQEVYPFFLGKMLEVNPNLKVSELTYCAYIYLGFSTKEIAEFTFKAVKTVENNRYNLRKKLKLSPDQDLSIWMLSFMGDV